MLVVGHRGSRTPGPENSPLAVAAALAAGADGVEIDLRRDATGAVVVSHDPVASREVQAEVPSLASVFAAVTAGTCICEIKNALGEPDHDATGRQTLDVALPLLRAQLESGRGSLVVSSFDASVAAAARSMGLTSALLTRPGVPVAAGVAAAARGGHRELHAHLTSVRLDRSAVRRCHDAGLRLVCWTITRPRQALRLRDAGVDAVVVDDPAAVVALLGEEPR